jgi:HSP20 family protein
MADVNKRFIDLKEKKMENKEMIPVKEEKNNLIEELLETQNYISPLVNIYETDDAFILSADMPGVVRKDLKVKVENDLLIMFGRIDYVNELNRNYILNEQELGNYYRTFRISDSVDKNNIVAKYDNGKLVVNLPKKEKVKPRTINIL